MSHRELSAQFHHCVVSLSDFGHVTVQQTAQKSPATHCVKVAPGKSLSLGKICRQRDEPFQQLHVTEAVGDINPVGIDPELIMADASRSAGGQCLVDKSTASRRVVDKNGQCAHDRRAVEGEPGRAGERDPFLKNCDRLLGSA